MESVRTVQSLALATAVVLVLSVLALVGERDGSSVLAIDETPAGTDADASATGAPGDGKDPEAAGTEGSALTDAVTDAKGDDASSGGKGVDAGDAATPGPGEASQPPVVASGLIAPLPGTYRYAASGTWGLNTDAMYTLPETAVAVVTATEGRWSWEFTAGDRFTDTLAFVETGEGIEWVGWEIYRRFSTEESTTPYACEADGAYHVPDNQAGRTAGHDCQAAGGAITTDGRLETMEVTTVQLGDGSVVPAVRIVYDSTDGGEGVSGGSSSELWLDPGTGLRLKEVRTVNSQQVASNGITYIYTEDVTFTLESLTPA